MSPDLASQKLIETACEQTLNDFGAATFRLARRGDPTTRA
jgi:hypothetical protein